MKKTRKILLVLFMIFTTSFVVNKSINAAPVGNLTIQRTGYTFAWSASTSINGKRSGYGELDKLFSDGLLTPCGDPGTPAVPGSGYASTPMIMDSVRIRLSRLAIANDINTMNDETFAAWQLFQHMIMFEANGFVITSTNVPNLQAHFTNFENNAVSYWTKPSFNFGDGTIKTGETKQFTVTNGVTSGWEIFDASENVAASFTNGILTVTNNNRTDTKISIQITKTVGSYKKLALVYQKANSQELVSFGLTDPDRFPIELTNLRNGDFELTKKDNFDRPLKDISFKLSYNADMSSPIGTYTTDANGQILVKDLELKNVYYQEVNTPSHLIPDTTIKSKMIEPSTKVNVDVTNTIKTGSLTLTKEDSETGNLPQGDAHLTGAKYGLYASADIIDPVTKETLINKDALVSEKTMDASLTLKWTDLKLGSYYVKETQAPIGYLLDSTKYPVNIDAVTNNLNINTVSKETVMKRAVQIIKVSSDGNYGELETLKGAEFTVSLVSTGAVVDVITTDENGYASTKELPYGLYKFEETKTPEGVITIDPFFVTINDDSRTPLPVKVLNDAPQKAYLKVVKKDLATGETILKRNVDFKIYNEDGTVYKQKVAGKWIDTFTTDEEGTLITPQLMKYGKYFLEEQGVIPGFIQATEKIPFFISVQSDGDTDADGDPIITIDVFNERPTAKIELTKTFEELTNGSDKIAGFELRNGFMPIISPVDQSTVLYSAFEVIPNPNSEDGLWYVKDGETLAIENLPLSIGVTTYSLTEKVTSEGYVLDPTVHLFNFTQENTTDKVFTKAKDVQNKLIRTNIQIEKINEYTKQNLSKIEQFTDKDIEFTMYSDEECTIEISKAYVDSKTGVATFKDVVYGQTVYIKETSALDTYYLSDEVYTVVVDKDLIGIGKEHTYQYVNKPVPTIGTKATGINGEKTLDPTVDNTLIDVSSVDNIDPSIVHTIRTRLWKYIENGDDELVAERIYENISFADADKEFTSEILLKENQITEGRYYFTEEFFNQENPEEPYLKHEDREDEDQTIKMVEKVFDFKINKINSSNNKPVLLAFTFGRYEKSEDGSMKLVESVNSNAEDGFAIFKNLKKGYHYFKEEVAPKGYVLSKQVVEVYYDGDTLLVDGKEVDLEDGLASIQYFNDLIKTEAIAPATGDTVNVSLLLFALTTSLGAILYVKKRKKEESDEI